jgi:hypothetical protein
VHAQRRCRRRRRRRPPETVRQATASGGRQDDDMMCTEIERLSAVAIKCISRHFHSAPRDAPSTNDRGRHLHVWTARAAKRSNDGDDGARGVMRSWIPSCHVASHCSVRPLTSGAAPVTQFWIYVGPMARQPDTAECNTMAALLLARNSVIACRCTKCIEGATHD